VRHVRRAAWTHAATTSAARPAGWASDGTLVGQVALPRAREINSAAGAQPGGNSARAAHFGEPYDTCAECGAVGLALAARPWVGGHILVTTQTRLNSDVQAPASRAGTSVAPAQSSVALPKFSRFVCNEGSRSKVSVRWMRNGEASSSVLVSNPSLPNHPFSAHWGLCAISFGTNL
jgi:hypothetical protein